MEVIVSTAEFLRIW